jgi:hypothetical protein
MSGVGAQGDPCTATILWSVVRPHPLYSTNSPVPLTKYIILHIVAWFHKNVVTVSKSNPSPLFLCISCGPYYSHKKWGIKTVTTGRAPCGCKSYTRRGAARCPPRDLLRHCCHHLSAMQPSARCLTPWLRWPRALFAALGLYRPPRRGRLGLGFGGVQVNLSCARRIKNQAIGQKGLSLKCIYLFRYPKIVQSALTNFLI